MNRLMRSISALLIISAAVFGFSAPASAALSGVELNLSASGAGDPGVRYTYNFTTGTTGTITSIAFPVPAGTAGTPTISDYFGIGPGTASLASNTLTYTVTSPVSLASGRTILIAFEGVTNTTTVGSFTPTVTTSGVSETGSGTAVAITASSADIVIDVSRVITFSTSSPSIALTASAASAPQADQSSSPQVFSIATNAGAGYSLSTRADDLISAGGTVLPKVSTGIGTGVSAGAFAVNTWGFTLGTPTNGGAGTISRAGALASDQYVGFPTASQTIATNSGPTNGDTFPLTARVRVDATQAAGSYSTTLVFTAAATY